MVDHLIELNILTLIWCVVALVLAGTVKGVLGIGVPVVSIPLLALVMQVPQAVALLPIPILISNIWQAFHGGYFQTALRRFWPLVLVLIIGTVIGAKLLATVDPRLLYGLIGFVVIAFSLWNHFQPQLRLPAHAEKWLGPVAGFAGGVLGGLSTIYGPPLIMFLVALRLPRDEFVGTISTLYLTGVIPLIIALGAFEVMGKQELVYSTLATIPLLLGVLIGQVLRRRLDEDVFRKALLVMLLIAGAALIRRVVLV